MNINEFIDIYVSMIIEPIIGGHKHTGFLLDNNTRILFKDSRVYPAQAKKLLRHYKKNGIINNE